MANNSKHKLIFNSDIKSIGNHGMKPYIKKKDNYMFFQGYLELEDVIMQYATEKASEGIIKALNVVDCTRVYLFYNEKHQEFEITIVKEHTDEWNQFHHFYNDKIIYNFTNKSLDGEECILDFESIVNYIYQSIILSYKNGKELKIISDFLMDKKKRKMPIKKRD